VKIRTTQIIKSSKMVEMDLAGERAIEVWVLEKTVACDANLAWASKGAGRWPLVQKYHFCAVCCVWLYNYREPKELNFNATSKEIINGYSFKFMLTW